MRYFNSADIQEAATAMLAHPGTGDRALMGLLSGIKRRARTRALLDFALTLEPAPPDASITSMRHLLADLFGRGLSNTTLHQYFGRPGRKADDRVDLSAFGAWRATHADMHQADAALLLAGLDEEWDTLTAEAAALAGRTRRAVRRVPWAPAV